MLSERCTSPCADTRANTGSNTSLWLQERSADGDILEGELQRDDQPASIETGEVIRIFDELKGLRG